jgi:hypothetical protein
MNNIIKHSLIASIFLLFIILVFYFIKYLNREKKVSTESIHQKDELFRYRQTILSSCVSNINRGTCYQTMNSDNGSFKLIMQDDGNLVISDINNKVLWASYSNGRGVGPYRLMMQPDGNLVIYDKNNSAIWNTGTYNRGVGPYRLVMQDDANLVIYDANNGILWASNSVSQIPKPLPDSTLPVTWVDKWANTDIVKSKIPGAFYAEGNNLYLSAAIMKFKESPQGPFQSTPDAKTVYIYNKFNSNSTVPSYLQIKKQLITYGITDRCNTPPNTDTTMYSPLCNGMVSFADTGLVDKVNTQFSQEVNASGIPYLLHKPTKLMFCYITVTQELLNAVGMYPISYPNAQWNYFYLIDIPTIQFAVGSYMQVGDIIPLIYVGNGLSDGLPKQIRIKLSSKSITSVKPTDTFNYTTKEYNVVINNYTKLTTNGNWIIQDPNGNLKRTYYIPMSPKLWRIATKDNIQDGTSDWEFVLPGLAAGCGSNQIFSNGACMDCGANQFADSSKTQCLPYCPSGQYLYSNGCQPCDGVVSDDKLTCFVGGKRLLGKVYENRPYEVKMEDGTFISMNDLLTFIAGPADSSSSECFHYRGCGWTSPWDCIKDAANWISDRAKDVGAFIKNAVDKVGDWAKNVGSAALNWAQNAGKTILAGLVKLGNTIGCYARKAFRAIADFFGDIFEKARNAFNSAINWVKNAAVTVWDTIKQPLGMIINLVLDNVECEYMIARNSSKLDAVKAIKPALVPPVRESMIRIIKTQLSAALATVTFGIGAAIVELVFTIVQQFSDFNQKVDSLLEYVFEQGFAVNTITTVADPVIKQVAKISCSAINPPKTDDIKINSTALNNVKTSFQ